MEEIEELGISGPDPGGSVDRWGVDLNDTTLPALRRFFVLDGNVVARPSNPPKGTRYLPAGSRTIERYNGNSWEPWGGPRQPDLESGPVTEITQRASRSAVYGFISPQAEYVPSENTTFVVYRGEDADPFATAYDHDTHSWSAHTRIGTNPLTNTDEHGIPGLAVANDGTLHVVYGTSSHPLQYARSDSPYDTASWSNRTLNEVPIGCYNSPAAIDGTIYIHYRVGEGHGSTYPNVHEHATLIKSTDGGDTFVDLGPSIDTTGTPEAASDPYVADCDILNGNVHVTWIVARGATHDEVRTGVYHAYYNPSDGNWHALDGSSLGPTIEWSDHNGAVEIDGREQTNVCRHALSETGDIAVTYSLVDNSGTAHWQLAEWDGSWSIEQLAETTRAGNYAEARWNDSGRLEVIMVVGPTGANPGDEGGTRGGSLARWRRRGDGSWAKEMLIAEQDDFTIARTACVRNGRDDFAALATEERPRGNDWDAALYGIGALRESPSTARH